jgi:hypothetical protein
MKFNQRHKKKTNKDTDDPKKCTTALAAELIMY